MKHQLTTFEEYTHPHFLEQKIQGSISECLVEQHQIFIDAFNAMCECLNLFEDLTFKDKVLDLEHILQTFKTYMCKASKATIVLEELIKHSSSLE